MFALHSLYYVKFKLKHYYISVFYYFITAFCQVFFFFYCYDISLLCAFRMKENEDLKAHLKEAEVTADVTLDNLEYYKKECDNLKTEVKVGLSTLSEI